MKMPRTDQNRRASTDDDDDESERNGFSPNGQVYSSSQRQQITRHDTDESEEEPENETIDDEAEDEEEEEDEADPANEVIEIDSDDSQDEMNVTNNNDRSKNEQNNNKDSDRESTSSDIVIVNDQYQNFFNDIERLSTIKSNAEQIHADDKVSAKNFKIHKLLGTGAYGKVFLVEKLDGVDKSHLYAMKVLEKNKVTQKKKTTEHTKTEREVLEKVIDCPFLATLYYAFQSADKLYLVMEFIQGGELFSHLYKSEHFSEHQVRFYIAEIIIALEQLHTLNIIYRDIKLENILLDADGHIIITDFGLSKELIGNARATSYCGTIEYMAPEIVSPSGSGHDLNVDWWSVGVLIIELLSGHSPFSKEGEESNQQLISERIQKHDPTIPPSIGKEARDLITKLLQKDPRNRLGYRHDAEEIKKHNFFRGIDWKVLKDKRYNAPMVPPLKTKYDVSQFSEDFTNQEAVDGPPDSGPLTAPNGKNFFRGYSFVWPRFRKKRTAPRIQELSLTENPPEMNRPHLNEVLKVQKTIESDFFDKYEFASKSDPIGDGTYSLCMKCTSLSTGIDYAVKIMKNDHDASQEIAALRKCQDHKNVVKLIETVRDRQFHYLVFELLSGGELFSRIRESGYLTENVALLYFKQIVDAVKYMHAKGIIHRDLKPENILFIDHNENSELRIVDFGFAQSGSSEDSPPCFTLDYAAPESLVRGETKPSRDLWSLGVILYTMLCGNTPFKPSSTANEQDERNFRILMTENIRNGIFNKDNMRWNQISDEAKDLITKLIRVNEAERISLKQVLQHPWMSSNFETSYESGNSGSIVRTESEETIVEDDEDDAIVIRDDENCDETPSIVDDSSSGIVMSDRNGGSSVSHEESDPSGQMFDNVEEELNVPIIEEQMEPENLSLKESSKIEEEPVVLEEEISEPVVKKSTTKRRVEHSQKYPIVKEISSPDLHTPTVDSPEALPLNLIVSPPAAATENQEEDFYGFESQPVDDPLKDIRETYSKLAIQSEQISEVPMKIEVVKAKKRNIPAQIHPKPTRRGGRAKAHNPNQPEIVKCTTKLSEVNSRHVVERIEPIPEIPLIANQPKKRGRKKASIKLVEPLIAQQPTPVRFTRNTARNEAQQMTQVPVPVVEVIKPLKRANRGRPPKRQQDVAALEPPPVPTKRSLDAAKVPVKETELQFKELQKFAADTVEAKGGKRKKRREIELLLNQAAFFLPTSTKRGRKRRFEEEAPPKKQTPAVVEKKSKRAVKETVVPKKEVRMTRKRRKEVDQTSSATNIPILDKQFFNPTKIKAEKQDQKPIIVSSRLQQSQVHQKPALSPLFKNRLTSIKKTYKDNKLQPSVIPRIIKPEPSEKVSIVFSEASGSRKYQFR